MASARRAGCDVNAGKSVGMGTLRGIDFDARAGERVAVVGESGCGKSSLLKLIPRLYDASGGRVEIDGRDVRTMRLRDLRHAVSFVPQEPILFHGTLYENLRHGSPDATRHDMARAAWIACLTDVVSRLPNGWDAQLGPMGVGLSGGEKQRVAITRALLQRRPILILDEATSALDAPTEHRILSRLERWCTAASSSSSATACPRRAGRREWSSCTAAKSWRTALTTRSIVPARTITRSGSAPTRGSPAWWGRRTAGTSTPTD